MNNTANAIQKEYDIHNQDGYEFSTNEFDSLIKDINLMEKHSRWHHDIETCGLKLTDIEGPLLASTIARKYGMEYDMVFDCASDGSKLILHNWGDAWLVRACARSTLCSSAKLAGSALGRMSVKNFATVMNYGFDVATGKSLILERFGMVTAVHSANAGGYEIMPISNLIDIATEELSARFGELDFKYGYNSHEYTSCIWELPEMKDDFAEKYQESLKNAASHVISTDFMPCIRFASSDTGASRAQLVPMFKTSNGTYFRFVKGVAIKHEKKEKSGLDRFREEAKDIFAKFNESLEQIEKMSKIEVWNPVNAVISICKKYGIPKKFGSKVVEEVQHFGMLSAHDIYLFLCETTNYAKEAGCGLGYIMDLEEALAKVLTADWAEHDVAGSVSW